MLSDALNLAPGSATAVVAGDTRVSFGELAQAAGAAVSSLVEAGVTPGELVAVCEPDPVAHLAAVAGAGAAGAYACGVNHRYPAQILEQLAARLSPAAWVGVARPKGVRAPADAGQARPAGGRDAPGVVVLSSGTTSLPRARVYTRASLDLIAAIDAGEPAIMLVAMPLGNLFMATRAPGVLARGGTLVALPAWNAGRALEAIAANDVDTVAGVPMQFADLLGAPGDARLRRCIIGGGRAPAGMVRALADRFGCDVEIRYSSSEAGPICSTGPVRDDDGTVGRALPGVEIALEDGRVMVRSAMSSHGEWAGAPSPAWIDTGDLGEMTPDGRLRLLGRADDSFTRSGNTISPSVIEAALEGAPGVTGAAVIWVEDARRGARVIAFVAGNVRVPDVTEHARSLLAPHLLPDEFVVIRSLPRTPGGKVDVAALREMHG